MIKFVAIFLGITGIMHRDSPFVFSKFNIEVDVPDGWAQERTDEKTFVFKEKCDPKVGFCPNLVARFVPLNKDLSLDELGEVFVASFQSKFENFEVIYQMDKTVGKFKMKVIDYKTSKDKITLGGTTAIMILDSDKTVFTLSMMAKNDEDGSYMNYRRKFEVILNSLKSL